MNREQEFLKKIEHVLHSYEEEYPTGAWEEFSREKKNRKRALLIWRLAGAAAVLLIAYVSLETFMMDVPPDSIAKKIFFENDSISGGEYHNKSVHDSAKIALESLQLEKLKPEKAGENRENKLITKELKERFRAKVSGYDSAKNDDSKLLVRDLREDDPDSANVTLPLAGNAIVRSKDAKKVDILPYDSFIDSLASQPDPEPARKKERKNLVYSLVLSPSLGSEKLNLGTGLEVAYKISDKLSLSGGLLYSSMNAKGSGDTNAPGDKTLQNVQFSVSGLEIPVGLQYQTKGGFYASASISGMSVISNRLEYNYLTQTTQTITVVSGGVPREIIRVVSRESTEKSREKIMDHIGFYNFSLGTKKAFGSDHLNIGPFIKVPFGTVSSERIKLTQGGFRLSLDF
ncbi:hypothetical protein [Desertivirga xinjiangensis]|uniref:hypothetical protein n=1 Tax=Desertivirga xinjiangensis TaxID=539206 RepID=UPI00210E5BBD|nr:hypothetical protein [Pedobacter xinjiangensis]